MKKNQSLISFGDIFLKELNSRIIGRLDERYLCKSFNEFDNSILEKLNYVDKYYQQNIISREIAIQIMSAIVELQGWYTKYSIYNQDLILEKLKELNELLWMKRKNMFLALENGRISKYVFTVKNSYITTYERNNFVNTNRLVNIMNNPEDLEPTNKK